MLKSESSDTSIALARTGTDTMEFKHSFFSCNQHWVNGIYDMIQVSTTVLYVPDASYVHVMLPNGYDKRVLPNATFRQESSNFAPKTFPNCLGSMRWRRWPHASTTNSRLPFFSISRTLLLFKPGKKKEICASFSSMVTGMRMVSADVWESRSAGSPLCQHGITQTSHLRLKSALHRARGQFYHLACTPQRSDERI